MFSHPELTAEGHFVAACKPSPPTQASNTGSRRTTNTKSTAHRAAELTGATLTRSSASSTSATERAPFKPHEIVTFFDAASCGSNSKAL